METLLNPLPPEDVRKIARKIIREEIGTLPSPGEPILTKMRIGEAMKKVYEVPIVVFYPVLITDPVLGVTRRLRFKNLGAVGKIIIDAFEGTKIERTQVVEIKRAIKQKLDKISELVDKILVRNEARKFANLTLLEHVHTPVEDVISNLMILGSMRIEELEILPEEEKEKYIRILNVLRETGLVDIKEGIILPGNILIEFESRFTGHEEILRNSLAYFFEKGYEYIDTIRTVLGPYLVITRNVYEISISAGELLPVEYSLIRQSFEEEYPFSRAKLKLIKLPRYLLQLENVKLLKHVKKDGKDCWMGVEDTFSRIMRDEETSKLLEQMGA